MKVYHSKLPHISNGAVQNACSLILLSELEVFTVWDKKKKQEGLYYDAIFWLIGSCNYNIYGKATFSVHKLIPKNMSNDYHV